MSADEISASFLNSAGSAIQLIANLVAHVAPNADTTWLGETFQPRGEVHTIAVNIIIFYDNIADVNSDAESDAVIFRDGGIALSHHVLDLYRAQNGLHRTRKLGEEAIAHQLDDAPIVLGDLGFNQLFAMCLEC